ncbi:hypothetical protein PIB30_038620 [Stylosanthes scabra]|uniref:Uncharacterized protein n=1 Tax=Stylosanthes scabra TaxID=79078 RepID=A0ABU6TDS0_9FABA|nr:hypothetical protein [Stylosanthes scabra]
MRGKGADEGDETGESRSRTWKPSTVIGKPPEKENNKHPSTLEVLSEELPMKFKYPMDKEPYDGTSDPKHYLDTFNNRMVLLNASDAVKCKAVTITLKKVAQKSECIPSGTNPRSTDDQELKGDRNAYCRKVMTPKTARIIHEYVKRGGSNWRRLVAIDGGYELTTNKPQRQAHNSAKLTSADDFTPTQRKNLKKALSCIMQPF